MFLDGIFNIVIMPILPSGIYNFNVIPIKTLARFFYIDKITAKFTSKYKESRIMKIILRKRIKESVYQVLSLIR